MGLKLNGNILTNLGNNVKLNDVFPKGLKINNTVVYRQIDTAATGGVDIGPSLVAVGETVSVTTNTVSDPDGITNPVYKWYSVYQDVNLNYGTPTLVATGTSSYTPTASDADKRIYVEFEYTNVGITKTITSSTKAWVKSDTLVGDISIIQIYGSDVSFAWYVNYNTPIDRIKVESGGKTLFNAGPYPTIPIHYYNSRYSELNQGQQTAVLSVRVNSTDNWVAVASTTFTISSVENPATGTIDITGSFTSGGILTADINNLNDIDGINNVTYSWVVNDGQSTTVVGSDSTYTIPANSDQNTIYLTVGYTEDDGDFRYPPASPTYTIHDVSISGLTKTTSAAWGNSGAESDTTYSGDIDLSWYITDSTHSVIGLSTTNADDNYTTINYGLNKQGNGTLAVFENGVNKGTVGTATASDLLRIKRIGSTITYWKNGTLLYTSTATTSSPLLVDVSLYTTGTVARDIQINGNYVNLTNINGADPILSSSEDIRPTATFGTITDTGNPGQVAIPVVILDPDSTEDNVLVTYGDGYSVQLSNTPTSGTTFYHSYSTNGTYTAELYIANTGKTPIKQDTIDIVITTNSNNTPPTVTIVSIT